MVIVYANIASTMKLLQRAIVTRSLPLMADQIAVRHGPLIAVHSTA